MMKKKYIAPEMIQLEVDHTDVICTSLQYGGYGNALPADAPELRQRGSGWNDYEM